MIGWLNLTDVQRKAVMDEAEIISGIQAKAIEKDWWVTLTLKALFQSAYRQHMVFKGGTSLSKCWNLIARFSEDIDIALDPAAFNMAYVENPTRKQLSDLKRAGCTFTSTLLRNELANQLRNIGLPEGMVRIDAAPVPDNMPDTDPQTLLVHYPSLYEPNDYIADTVKIEVSVRSMRIPFTTVNIQSILHAFNPKPAYAEIPFPVEVVEPRKTFLEKIFLLHEEFGKPDKARIRAERMSRHLYDLYKIMDSAAGIAALTDHQLYDDLIQHRQWYSRISWVDYASLSNATISFIPVDEVIEDYRQDYERMREQMIYEDAPTFNEVISSLKILRGRVRLKYEQKTLDEVVNLAIATIEAWPEFDRRNGASYSTPVIYVSDPYLPTGPGNKTITFEVSFNYNNNRLNFESISIQPQA